MHFDDRLGTVLRLSMGGPAGARIQYRQLLDLLGTAPAEARGAQLDAAYVRLSELSATIPSSEQAAALTDAGLRLRSPRLVAALAANEPTVARKALKLAQLSPEQWRDLVPALPPASRIYLRERSDLGETVVALLSRLGVNDRGLPGPALQAGPDVNADSSMGMPVDGGGEEIVMSDNEPATVTILSPAATAQSDSGISAIVKRIEAYRRAKQIIEPIAANDSPRLPLGEEQSDSERERARAFDFATDAQGRIVWSDPGVLPMVSGMAMAGDVNDASLDHAIRLRQPLRARQVDLAGARAIAGRWQIDASPWFDPLSGAFSGYRGRMRRPAPLSPSLEPVLDSQADRIRQMLHELRTPVNAIQGFAEIIQQQLFGPAPHDYRALAANVAGDAARMLAAFEELERLARLTSGAMTLETGDADLAAVVDTTVAQLGAHGEQRGSGFELRIKQSPLFVRLARLELERIVWRALATLAGASAPGEKLRITLRENDGQVRIDIALPASLAKREDLFETAPGTVPQTIAAGVFGIGFALRLARAEARAANGDLRRKDDRLRLTLPGLTDADQRHTQAGH